ncbi:MAG: type II toxin-antitoxin system prevent-host-death family antitoxin [Rubritalea sp.]|uniref:type II toxin-antitoxin system Phd/YefM family antitoxin n=1 Tax=Rubritalea sp. TaxID=2109375 RepID=UPI003242186D
MRVISTILEAKSNLSELIQKALAGEEVITANRNQPLAMLMAIDSAEKPKRKIGTEKHLAIKIGDDFDEPIDELFERYYPDELKTQKIADDEAKYKTK